MEGIGLSGNLRSIKSCAFCFAQGSCLFFYFYCIQTPSLAVQYMSNEIYHQYNMMGRIMQVYCFPFPQAYTSKRRMEGFGLSGNLRSIKSRDFCFFNKACTSSIQRVY